MLTPPVENGTSKCEEYYINYDSNESKYSLRSVDITSTEKDPVKIDGFSVREVTFTKKANKKSYSFIHFLYEKWPSETSLDVSTLYHLVNGLHKTFIYAKEDREKVIIHCR